MQKVDLHLLQFLLVLDAPTMHTSTPPAEQGTYNFNFSYIFFSEHAHILRNNHCMQGAICRGGISPPLVYSSLPLLNYFYPQWEEDIPRRGRPDLYQMIRDKRFEVSI